MNEDSTLHPLLMTHRKPGVVDWIGETCDGSCDGLLDAAGTVSDALDGIGIPTFFENARDKIRAALEIDSG